MNSTMGRNVQLCCERFCLRLDAAPDPGFAKEGRADHGERASLNGGLLQRGPGTEPLVGCQGVNPLKLKAFVHFHTKGALKLRI